MRKRLGLVALCWCAMLNSGQVASAGVVYSQNFESPVSLFSNSVGPGSYVNVTDNAGGSNWQIQGGDGSPGGVPGISVVGGIDNNGVGGSQALFANWNFSPNVPEQHGWYTWNQETVYDLPGMTANTQLSDVTISLDIYIEGSTTNNPVNVEFQGSGGNRSYTPLLANGQYTSVSFTLNQATGGTPNLTMPFNLQVNYGAGSGFGFDAGNIVRIDNVTITNAVPEPGTCALLTLGVVATWTRRRRK